MYVCVCVVVEMLIILDSFSSFCIIIHRYSLMLFLRWFFNTCLRKRALLDAQEQLKRTVRSRKWSTIFYELLHCLPVLLTTYVSVYVSVSLCVCMCVRVCVSLCCHARCSSTGAPTCPWRCGRSTWIARSSTASSCARWRFRPRSSGAGGR